MCYHVMYGDQITVVIHRLWSLPYQAIECYLASVMPVEAEWSVNSGNFLWEKCGQSECLYAQVRLVVVIK